MHHAAATPPAGCARMLDCSPHFVSPPGATRKDGSPHRMLPCFARLHTATNNGRPQPLGCAGDSPTLRDRSNPTPPPAICVAVLRPPAFEPIFKRAALFPTQLGVTYSWYVPAAGSQLNVQGLAWHIMAYMAYHEASTS